MSYSWEEPKQSVVFNNGKAGEVVCEASVRSTEGETGPNGNPLPPFMLSLRDGANVDDQGNPKTIEVPYYIPTLPNEGDSRGETRLRAQMSSVRALFEAFCPDQGLPDGDTPVDAFNAAMEACIKAGNQMVRAFVHYEKNGKAFGYLNMLTGFKKGIVNAKNTSFVFPDTAFMSRPPKANAESTTTDAAVNSGGLDL